MWKSAAHTVLNSVATQRGKRIRNFGGAVCEEMVSGLEPKLLTGDQGTETRGGDAAGKGTGYVQGHQARGGLEGREQRRGGCVAHNAEGRKGCGRGAGGEAGPTDGTARWLTSLCDRLRNLVFVLQGGSH